MININCSFNCVYAKNGKCTLNHIEPFSMISNISADCAYYTEKGTSKKTPPKS